MNNKEQFNHLLQSTKREGIKELIIWLEGTDFYTAPASSKKEYHGAYNGGLLSHSLDVFEIFRDKCLEYKIDINPDSIIIISLLHDLCKIGLYNEVTEGQYIYNKNIANEGHGKRSVYLANKFIDLTEEEVTFILFHMGIWNSDAAYFPEYKTSDLISACGKFQHLQLFWAADVESLYYDKLKHI